MRNIKGVPPKSVGDWTLTEVRNECKRRTFNSDIGCSDCAVREYLGECIGRFSTPMRWVMGANHGWTEADKADAQALLAEYPHSAVSKDEEGFVWVYRGEDLEWSRVPNKKLFPSLVVGQTIFVEAIVRDNNNE